MLTSASLLLDLQANLGKIKGEKMEIDVKKFSKIQDIYISPDPQEYRPAWIWFAYIDDDLAVAAGRGTASSWWNSAMISKKGASSH